MKQCLQQGWSRNILDIHIQNRSYEREGKAILNVTDEKLRQKDDQAGIGLILCQDKNKVVAEYALKNINKAIGVSEYQLTQSLPEELESSLPTIDEIERELGSKE